MMRAALFAGIVATLIFAACSDRTAEGALHALSEGKLARAREIYSSGVDPDERVNGQTALTIAVCHSSPEVIEFLLDLGADPNRTSRRRQTPLIHAARCGNLPAVQVLLEAGADPNIAAPGGETALSAAREKGEEEVVALLLQAGVDADPLNSAGRREATGY